MMRYLRILPVVLAVGAWLSQFAIRDGGVGIANGLVVFIIIWWLVLFMMLPIGVRSQEECGDIVDGSEPGAPSLPMMKRKAWWATVAASVIWLIYFIVTETGMLNAWFASFRY